MKKRAHTQDTVMLVSISFRSRFGNGEDASERRCTLRPGRIHIKIRRQKIEWLTVIGM